MLGSFNIRPDIAVKDLARAKDFYEDVLGLKLVDENDEELVFQSGSNKLNVYRSEYAGTNQATYVSWDADDVDAAVEALKGKGMAFEHYDMPGMTLEGDVHVMDGMRAAWFKDPDGNVLCVSNDKR
jgi:catechol 2,3-dioxygenase-like lactoylglutathione lyase family enzyme